MASARSDGRGAPSGGSLGVASVAGDRSRAGLDAAGEGRDGPIGVASRCVERAELQEKRCERPVLPGVRRPRKLSLERDPIRERSRATRGDLGRRHLVLSCAGANQQVAEHAARHPIERAEIVGSHFENTAAGALVANVEIENDDRVAALADDHQIVRPAEALFQHQPLGDVAELAAAENAHAVVEQHAVAQLVKRREIRGLRVRDRPVDRAWRFFLEHAGRREKAARAIDVASAAAHAYLLAP